MKIDKSTKIQAARFFETEIEKNNNGVTISLPDDILRHLGVNLERGSASVFFTVINGVVQVTTQPKTEFPLFSPDDFENAV